MTTPPPPPSSPAPQSAYDTTPAVLAHLGGLFVGFLAPLIVYVVSDANQFAKDHAREALNFHIAYMVYVFISLFLVLVLVGVLLLVVLGVSALVFTILATIAASRGERYRYPLVFRLLR